MVYLAETTGDLTTTRDRIRRELLQRGTTSCPTDLPRSASELQASAREHLERCARPSTHRQQLRLIRRARRSARPSLAGGTLAADARRPTLVFAPALDPMGLAAAAPGRRLTSKSSERLAAGAELLQTSSKTKTRIMESSTGLEAGSGDRGDGGATTSTASAQPGRRRPSRSRSVCSSRATKSSRRWPATAGRTRSRSITARVF